MSNLSSLTKNEHIGPPGPQLRPAAPRCVCVYMGKAARMAHSSSLPMRTLSSWQWHYPTLTGSQFEGKGVCYLPSVWTFDCTDKTETDSVLARKRRGKRTTALNNLLGPAHRRTRQPQSEDQIANVTAVNRGCQARIRNLNLTKPEVRLWVLSRIVVCCLSS